MASSVVTARQCATCSQIENCKKAISGSALLVAVIFFPTGFFTDENLSCSRSFNRLRCLIFKVDVAPMDVVPVRDELSTGGVGWKPLSNQTINQIKEFYVQDVLALIRAVSCCYRIVRQQLGARSK